MVPAALRFGCGNWIPPFPTSADQGKFPPPPKLASGLSRLGLPQQLLE